MPSMIVWLVIDWFPLTWLISQITADLQFFLLVHVAQKPPEERSQRL